MKKEETIIQYDLYGEESGYIESFETLEELNAYLKELKAFDKRNGIKERYYVEENEN